MNKKCEKLLEYLAEKKQWIASNELSDFLGVSKRQVANYVNEINSNAIVITSSSRGYKICSNFDYKTIDISDEITPEKRQQQIITDLAFNSNGFDIYEEADKLFVSTSTIENDINYIKNSLSQFNIKISKKNDIYNFVGIENNIRHFIVIRLFKNRLEDFDKAFNNNKLLDLRLDLKKIIQQSEIFINDYSLALFTLNICVGILRCQLGFTIKDKEINVDSPKQYLDAIKHICEYITNSFGIALSDSEKEWILETLLSSSTTWDPKTINNKNLANYVETKYIHITEEVINEVTRNFPDVKFDDDFYVRFTIHIRNCFIHKDYETYNIDSLTKKIKYNYPMMFEVAVFIADFLENHYGLSMSQNELTYIAFHICSSLNDFSDYQVTITYVYADYWDYHKKVLDQLISCIGEKGLIKQSVSISDYIPSLYHSDLIVTDSNAALPEPCVVISSIPSKENTLAVANFVDRLYLKKQYTFFINNFMKFFDSNLFIKRKENNYLELIKVMCDEAKKRKYVNGSFYPDILKREKLDNTAFNSVAIPHTLTVSANKTFISIAICDNPIKWSNDNEIKIVAMLGINKKDRKTFSHIYDFLVNILSDNENISSLAKAKSFDEFIYTLQKLANNIN